MVRKVHTNVLVKSDMSCLEGCQALEERFLTVCNRYAKKWGVDLPVPTYMQKDFIRWRTLVRRYNVNDFRHTEAELRSLKEIAQWTVDENAKLCGQPDTKIKWRA